jgi:hypothetical protein
MMNIFETKKVNDNFYLIGERISPKMDCLMGAVSGERFQEYFFAIAKMTKLQLISSMH